MHTTKQMLGRFLLDFLRRYGTPAPTPVAQLLLITALFFGAAIPASARDTVLICRERLYYNHHLIVDKHAPEELSAEQRKTYAFDRIADLSGRPRGSIPTGEAFTYEYVSADMAGSDVLIEARYRQQETRAAVEIHYDIDSELRVESIEDNHDGRPLDLWIEGHRVSRKAADRRSALGKAIRSRKKASLRDPDANIHIDLLTPSLKAASLLVREKC